MSIWAVSHELFGATNHGLPVAQLHDGDWLVVAGNNEVQLIRDASPASTITWTGLSHGVVYSFGYGIAHLTTLEAGWWFPRVTGTNIRVNPDAAFGGGTTGLGSYYWCSIRSFQGSWTGAQFKQWMEGSGSRDESLPMTKAWLDPIDGGMPGQWKAGPHTVGLYWLHAGLADNPAANARIHWDRLDGRMVAKPDVYERVGGAWVQRDDDWPAPGAAFNQGAMAQTHGWVWTGSDWKPLGRHAAVWTGSQWVSP
jgi:hypothetical protein